VEVASLELCLFLSDFNMKPLIHRTKIVVTMLMKILILNAGSSSQKSCLYDLAVDTPAVRIPIPSIPSIPLWEASVDWTYQPGAAKVQVKTANAQLTEMLPNQLRREVLAYLLATLWQGETAVLQSFAEIDAVGHRVVHGGREYTQPVQVTAEVKTTIARLAALAPAHNPANLEGIEAMETILGETVPQVAVFDTAFHHDLPEAAAIYPGPYAWVEGGIRRYGFHGISHGYCAQRAAQLLGRDDLRLIICHLGNGCSLSAVEHGRCIDTTMGFTPLDGLMMGSRSGSVDPGILIYLLRSGYSADQLDRELNKDSGLKGISSISADMRQIMTAIGENNPQAKLALAIYLHRLRSGIGGMLASLGGLDALVFTAGVGENVPLIRAEVCAAFGFLGLTLDPVANQNHPVDQDIATAESAIRILVIHTQEDWAIAQDTLAVLGAKDSAQNSTRNSAKDNK
jgi:acetate kinase